METIVIGTKEYAWAVAIFTRLFKRHWGGKLVWYGDRTDEVPDGVEFRPCPVYPEIWPWEHWFGQGLISIMDDLENDVFALFLPDHWLCEKVDLKAVGKLSRHVTESGKILRCGLTQGMCTESRGEKSGRVGGMDLMAIPRNDPGCSLFVTFAPALWDRRIFRRVPDPFWDLWKVEVLGSRRVADWDVAAVDAVPGPVKRCHGIRHGEGKTACLEGLSAEDAEMVKAMLPGGWSWRS